MKLIIAIGFLGVFSNVFSQDWRDSLEEARLAYKSKEYPKALQFYKSAQKLAPKGFDFSNEIAQTTYKLKSFADAEKLYSTSAAKSSNQLKKASQFHNLGNAQMQQKNYSAAIDSYKKALRNNPYDNQTRYNLSEAIRKLKEQQNKNNPKNNDKNQKDNQQKNNDNQKDKQKEKQKDESKLKNQDQSRKEVDRILDKLTKQESETKRKISDKKGEKGQTISGKDW